MNKLEKHIFKNSNEVEEKISTLLEELNSHDGPEKNKILTRYVLADTAIRSIVENIQKNSKPDDIQEQTVVSPILLDILKDVTVFLVLCKKFGLAEDKSDNNKKD